MGEESVLPTGTILEDFNVNLLLANTDNFYLLLFTNKPCCKEVGYIFRYYGVLL